MRITSLSLCIAVAFSPLGAQRGGTPVVGGPAPLVTLPAPAGVVVRNDPAELVFAWQPVAGAVGYQIDAAPAVEGPWTALVPSTQNTAFSFTPSAGILTYYRIAALHTLGNAGHPAIVPFIFNAPFFETGRSATQLGGDVTVSWTPVAGATSYAISVFDGSRHESRQLSAPSTATTFAALIAPGNTGRLPVTFNVVAQYARGAGVSIGKGPWGQPGVAVADPNVCWPAAGGTPGGPAPVNLSAAPMGNAVSLTWMVLGQVLAHRVERALANSGKWESVGCVATPLDLPFVDHSVELQPSTGYTYRVSAIGPNGITGTSLTTVATPPPETLITGVHVNGRNVGLGALGASPHATAYHISSSYGYRALDQLFAAAGGHSVANVPLGTHTFTIKPRYRNGALGRGTTATVTVQ